MQIVIIAIINIIGSSTKISSYGLYITLYASFSGLCLIILQKSIITPINILYLTFILFSAGIPIAYCVNDDYYNYYMSLFSNDTIIKAARYTLWSIQGFSCAMILAINPNSTKKKKIIFSENSAIKDEKYVIFVAKSIFVISSLVTIPLYSYVAYLSVSTGFSQATRAIVASNSLFNLARAFYIPSFFLLCSYGKEVTFTKISKYIFFLTCVLSLLSGNRTDGILWLITYIYYNRIDYKNRKIGQISLLIGITIIVYLAVIIGQSRTGTNMETGTSLLMSTIGEMGFNFTSICFIISYIPSLTGFKYGFTYLNSILCMVPKSLDFFHLFDALNSSLPIQWLFDVNHIRYNGLLDFGVGFSTIAESYMNFANFGVIISIFYALIICKVFGGKWNTSSKWEKYIQMIMFLTFMMFPRRAFNELLNYVEYSILFIALLIILFYSRHKKKYLTRQ